MNYNKNPIITEDGSLTYRIEGLKESYHSRHGALTESQFVYINEGFRFWKSQNTQKVCRILELGYGTGLMSYLSYIESTQLKSQVDFTSLEAYPLSLEESRVLKYNRLFESTSMPLTFDDFSIVKWNQNHQINSYFSFEKKHIRFEDFNKEEYFDVIFYDAFGAHAQPELWEPNYMQKCYQLLRKKGVWVSYCAKGSVRRGLEKAGFETFRLPGPPGKREMLRAIKS
jgi:tRNA U34 5-methylaminomethyl-2-thiouridine-forming methyltransferase MnmC